MTKSIFKSFVGAAVALAVWSCSRPFEEFHNQTWKGTIYRSDDCKALSEVAFLMKPDTLFIYSNAIFGAGNDTLLLQSMDKKDSVFHYRSLKGVDYSFKASVTRKQDELYLFLKSHGFFIAAQSEHDGQRFLEVPQWYWNCKVPHEPFMYLSGTYEGRLEMNRQWDNLELMSVGGVGVRLDFLDHFKVRLHVKSLAIELLAAMAGNSKPLVLTYDYRIEGNTLYIDPQDKNVITIEVTNEGRKLVYYEDAMTIELYKKR